MITFSEQRDIAIEQILPLYELNDWSSDRKGTKPLDRSHHVLYF
jgi:hypothetical protein